ncbi:unnamed protein product, partial [Effrenium voratum]
MALVDSRAAFEQRCQEIDSSGDLFRGLDSQNIRTFSQLAFISGTPQQPMNQDDFAQLSAQVFGEGADLGVAANLRRLQFEATTLVIADLKSKVSSSSQPEATQLPAAEKAARKRDQRARLRGILAKGELEPSDALLDLAAGIVESNVVLWISPERCGKREDELLLLNKNNRQVLSVDADTIKLSSAKPEVKADVGTELRLQWALQRRGLAFDSCLLVDWSVHEAWVQQLMTTLTRPSPQGYASVKVAQLMKADQQLWLLASDEGLPSLKPAADGVKPLNPVVEKLRVDPRVTMHLLPLPTHVAKESTVAEPKTKKASKVTKPSAKDKAPLRFKARGPRMPEELRPFQLQTATKQRICYGYNLAQGFDSEPKADTPEGVEAPFEKSEEDTLLQKLSQAVTKVALQAMAIDHTISKAAKQHVVIMDLSKEHGIAECDRWRSLVVVETLSLPQSRLITVVTEEPLELKTLWMSKEEMEAILVEQQDQADEEKSADAPGADEAEGQVGAVQMPVVDADEYLEDEVDASWADDSLPWGYDAGDDAAEERPPDVQGALLLAEHGSFADDAVMEKIVLGVPRKPADFIQAAVQAGHPRSLAVTLNAVSEDAVVANRDWPVTDLIRARIDFLTYWMKRAQELEHAEKTLHLSMPEYLQQVLRGKRILLMGEMLERLGFEDKYLQQDVSEGFKLTGWLRETGCFPKKIRKPTMPAAAVMAMASSVNQRIVKQMAETSFSETDAKAWNETLAELERGWIFRDDAPDLGKVLLAKRFGLAQKEKTRVIDDFSVGGLNSLAGLREKLAVQSIDEIAAHLAFVIDSKSSRSMGGVLGKTYDLTSAYKQYGVHPSDRDLARIAVKTPSGELAFFGTNALPFGAVGSVGGFLRISAALTFAGLKGPKLWWTSFYDDFTVFSDARALTSAAVSAEALFDLWGVKFAKDGKKSVDFSATVKSLGLLIGLDTILEGRIRIMHTPERKAELEEALKGILEA